MADTNKKAFLPISNSDAKKVSISTLADRPNVVSRYGDGGLSASELKARFDALPELNRKKINELVEIFATKDSTKYFVIDEILGNDNLYDFLMKFTTKEIGDVMRAAFTPEGEKEAGEYTVNEIFRKIVSTFSDIRSKAQELEDRTTVSEGNIETNKQNISTNAGEIDKIKQNILAVEDNISDNTKNISGNREDIDEHSEVLTAHQTSLDDITKTTIPAINKRLDGHDDRLAAAESDIKDAAAAIGSILGGSEVGNNLPTIIKRVEEVEESNAEAVKTVNDLSETVTAKLEEVTETVEGYTETINEVKGVSSTVSGLVTATNTHTTDINILREKAEVYDAKIPDHDERLAGIEAYLGGDNFLINDKDDLIKITPKNACEKAKILTVGGMTHKLPVPDDNLFPYPYFSVDGGNEANGVITVYEQDRNGCLVIIVVEPVTLAAGHYILDLGNTNIEGINVRHYDIGPNETITIYKMTNSRFEFQLNSATNFNGIVITTLNQIPGEKFYPLIYPKDKPAMWIDRGSHYLEHAKVTEIKSKGKNLIDVSKALNANFVDNGDGTYTLTQNGNGQRFSAEFEINIPPNSTLTYSATTIASQLSGDFGWRGMQVQLFNDTKDVGQLMMGFTKTLTDRVTHARLYIDGVEAVGNYITVSDIQIEYGSTKTEYEPYVGTLDTFSIPEVVRNREGYGLGVSSEYNNHIAYTENGKVIYYPMCKEVVFDGSEVWYANDLNGGFNRMYAKLPQTSFPVDINQVHPSVCNYYPTVTAENTYFRITGCSLQNNSIHFYDENYQTVGDWKAHLAELYAQGNPLTVVYALAEPIVADITDLMPESNLIRVKGGGHIAVKEENDTQLDVPTEIKYLVYYPKGETL